MTKNASAAVTAAKKAMIVPASMLACHLTGCCPQASPMEGLQNASHKRHYALQATGYGAHLPVFPELMIYIERAFACIRKPEAPDALLLGFTSGHL